MMDLENKIITKKRFSDAVEQLVVRHKLPFMEAVIEVCDSTGIDPADVKRLLSDSITNKIEAEAMNLNMIPKTNELPFDD